MAKFFRLDTDQNGTDSFQSYIDAGKVENLECPTFEVFDKHRLHLMRVLQPGDWVCIDTANVMLNTTRMDKMLGSNPGEPLWNPAQIDKFFKEKEGWGLYTMPTAFLLRSINNFRARGARVIVLCHEDEQDDEHTGLTSQGPQGNPDFVKQLIARSSDLFRLYSLPSDIRNEQGEVVFKAETRVLYLRRTDQFQAKFHVERQFSDGIPKALTDPTLPKLWATLHKQSSVLCIYGHPGAGKSSLAVTATDGPSEPAHASEGQQ